MLLGNVVGNVISTIKTSSHEGKKLMIVEFIDINNKPYGIRQIAIDAANAGIGDMVLINTDGGAALMILDNREVIIDMVICGIIDEYTIW